MDALRPRIIDPDDWVLAAACRGSGHLFFAPDDGAESRIERRRRESAAKAICAGCVVRRECLDEAVAASERFGVWGGMTERERRAAFGRSRPITSDIAGPGRPVSLPAAVVRGRPMSEGRAPGGS